MSRRLESFNEDTAMKLAHLARITALSCSLVLLTACTAFVSADHELDAASRQLATGKVTLTAEADDVPDAAITPQGDFLVAGKAVALTPQQRREVSAYRAQYIAIARQGIAIGQEGVDVGRRAVVPMVFAALSGASDDAIEARMKKRLAGVREATAKLCDRLPDLMAAQRQLAGDLPAFAPYATLTQADIEDCRKDVADGFDVANARNDAGE
jgi:hypothetical protein